MVVITLVGFTVGCALVKATASIFDQAVSVWEEKTRIDAQVARLKPWGKCTVARQTIVTSPQNREDMKHVGSSDLELHADLSDDEYVDRMTNARSAYLAQEHGKQEGHKFDDACDKCCICGGPDPESKGAQHKMRQKLGVTEFSEEVAKAYLKSQGGKIVGE